MKISNTLLWATLACASVSVNAESEEINPQTVVSSSSESSIETITVLGAVNASNATLGGIELKELPLNAHVVGQVELERIRFVDPDELLDRIPGETQVRNLRIPNGGKSYTLAFVDGVPIENPYSGATQRLDRVNTADIQRVEVIKGPASALYPNNVFGGVVNVVTKDVPEDASGSVSVEAGNFGRQRMGVDYGASVGELAYSVNVNRRKLEGLRDGTQNDRDAVSAKLVYDLSDNTRVSARVESFEEVSELRGNLSTEQIRIDPRQAGGLSSATDLEQDTVSIAIRHQTDSGEFNGVLLNRAKELVGLSRFRGPQDSVDDAVNAKLSYRHRFGNGSLIVGLDSYSGDVDTKQFGRSDVTLSGDFTRFSAQQDIDAVFLQYQVKLAEPLTLIAGVRHEQIDLSSDLYLNEVADFDTTAPKLGFTLQASDTTQLWFSVSEGFYAPDLDDLFNVDNGNPLLEPEEALNIEFGLRGQIGNWAYDSSLYQNRIKNYLVTQERVDGSGVEFELTSNAGQVTVRGIESVFEYAPQDASWRVGVTHTLADNHYDRFVQSTVGANDDFSGNELARSPKHHLNLRLAWEPISDLIAEVEGDFYSRYFANDANSPEGEFKRDERLNLRLSYTLDHWRVWANILNVTNTLEDRASYSRGNLTFRTIDGRSYYAGVSYQF